MDIIYFYSYFLLEKEMLMESEMEMNSRTTAHIKNTQSKQIILLLSPFTLIRKPVKKKKSESKRKEKKCLEFASIYTYCVIVFLLHHTTSLVVSVFLYSIYS